MEDTLTMRDVAALAQVHRSVVSMWRLRTRVRGVTVPFPEPVNLSGDVERFARADIEGYLHRTGRGNNPDYALDAPALAVPVEADLERLVVLLCWHALTGGELAGTTAEQRLAAARELDPDDVLLTQELATLEPRREELEYVDGLVAASFGAADALDRLESGRSARPARARGLSAEALTILRHVSRVAGDTTEAVAPVYAEDTELALALADDTLIAPAGEDSVEARRFLRRARIRGIDVDTVRKGANLLVATLVGLPEPTALERLDGAVLELSPDDVAVVLGPAKLLCDELRGDQEKRRAQTLRSRRLALALRLPRGLWRGAHRQSLGLWVCRGGPDIDRPRVADLAAVIPHDLELDDLAADVAGALVGTDARGYRYARNAPLAPMLAGGPVVPRGVRAARFGTAAAPAYSERVHAAMTQFNAPVAPLDFAVGPGPGAVLVRQRSLGELRDDGLLVMRRGSRVRPEDADPAGSVVVLPEELSGPLRLDAFDAARLYPRAHRTEPGDVVFVEKPRPQAWLDEQGGALVASPARVLRLREQAPLGPRVLALVVNHLAAPGTEWQSWQVPVLAPEERDRLEEALAAVQASESEARRRLHAVGELARTLVKGVAAGALTLTTPTTDMIVTKER